MTNSGGIDRAIDVAYSGIGVGIGVALLNPGGGASAIDVVHAGFGPGVRSTSAGGHGLWGVTEAMSAAGVLADNPLGEAIVGRRPGRKGADLFDPSDDPSDAGIGAVVGRNDGRNGPGVRGFQTHPLGGYGVLGQAGISGGVGTAVRAENVNAANAGNALEAVTNNAAGASAILGQAPAGSNAATFNGKVQINGDLTVTGAKFGFHIDDPRAPAERTLTHTPVESDALTVVYSGNARTGRNGRATVKLPSYATVLGGDWRYQLTTIGRLGQVIVERELRNGAFVIRTQHANTKVSWMVTGLRTDRQAKAHPVIASQAKLGDALGKHLDPAFYGKAPSLAATPPLKLTASSSATRAAGSKRLASGR